jgi:hypothetical protein
MQEAFAPFDVADLVFVVLTLTADEHHRAQVDLEGVYRDLRRRVEKWMKRMRRQLRRMGLDPFGSEWCATVEAHLSDVPHVNILIACPAWARWLQERYEAKREVAMKGARIRVVGARACAWCGNSLRKSQPDDARFCSRGCRLEHSEATLLDGPFADHLEPCGLGWRSTAEVPRGKDAVNGYLTKLAAEADKTHGEMAKRTQLPLRAPKGFRRLRSGRRFLPPRRKGDATGAIVRRVWTTYGDEEVRPLVQSKNLDYMKVVHAVCELEQSLAWKEEDERARERLLKRCGYVPTRKTRDEQTTSHRLNLGRAPPTPRGGAPTGGAPPAADSTTRPPSG